MVSVFLLFFEGVEKDKGGPNSDAARSTESLTSAPQRPKTQGYGTRKSSSPRLTPVRCLVQRRAQVLTRLIGRKGQAPLAVLPRGRLVDRCPPSEVSELGDATGFEWHGTGITASAGFCAAVLI